MKRAEYAHILDAYNIAISTDTDQMTAVNNKFDPIIDAVPYTHNLNPYTPSLSLNSMVVPVEFLGNLAEPLLNTTSLMLGLKIGCRLQHWWWHY